MRRPFALPVMIQVAALAAFAIILSHAVTFGVLALSPEPQPAGFSIEAAARALRGEAAETADGRALRRRLSDAPVVPVTPNPLDPLAGAIRSGLALARDLGVGVHLPARALSELSERPLPEGVLVAASCHTLDELRAAEALGCDFVVVGPVRETTSHPGKPGMGWDRFAALREQVSLPIYAIGGLSPDDLAEARRHGAQGIAAIRGFWPDQV